MSEPEHRGGYMLVLGPCLTCGRRFGYNPDHVPSLRWPQPDGPREPVCAECMVTVNRLRVQDGKKPHPIHPNAYGPEPA